MTTSVDLWPPFALRISAGPLELRAITDADIPPLVDLVLAGLHEPGEMPFLHPWTDAPPDELARNTAAYYWRTRVAFEPAAWTLDLAVRHEGVLVGVQGFATTDYLVTRTGETGSWLGREWQNRGIGTLMRQMMCAFVFDHLGAVEITSGAFLDNPTSLAVSRKVGYIENGTSRHQRRTGEAAVNQRLVLLPEAFQRAPFELDVTGADVLCRYIGLDTATAVPIGS